MGQTTDFYSGVIGAMTEQVVVGIFCLQDKTTLDVVEEQNEEREMI